MFRILIALLILPCLGFGRINDQLSLILDLQPGDSVVSITKTGPETIEVRVVDSSDAKERTLTGAVTPRIMERLMASAEAESIPWTENDFQPVPAPAPEPATGTQEKAGQVDVEDGEERVAGEKVTQSALRKNKFRYISAQTVFSSYTYGFALPIAFEAPEKSAAFGLLAIPVSFGAHYAVAWNKDYHDSHLFATSYFASNALLFSYALPFLALGPDFNAFRVGTFSVLAAYPLGLHYGYKHGTRFQDEPGRVSLQSSFAFTSGVLGYIGIGLWAPALDDADVGVRLVVAQVLGAGIAGHYLSYKYRTHEMVPGGIGPGIGSFALLGGLTSGSLLATIKPDSPEAFSGILLAGVGAGFFGGQKFFYDKYDTFERSAYNSLGMGAGAITPLGFMLLLGSFPDDPAGVMWTMTGGAFAGYFLTRAATQSLVEKPRGHASEKGFFKNFAFNPVPMPVPEYVDGKHSIRLVAPLLTATF